MNENLGHSNMRKDKRVRTFLAIFLRKENSVARTEEFLVLLVMNEIRIKDQGNDLYPVGSVDPLRASQC